MVRSLIALLLTSTLAQAEPVVIYDSGRGVPTAPYLTLFDTGNSTPDFRQTWVFQALPEEHPNAEKPAPTFPIRTTRLTPKRLIQEQEGYFPAMLYPLCVIGTDELSKIWLSRNLKPLLEMGAQCLLVSAETADEARELVAIAPGLTIYPAHGDAIAETFKIAHYPVLITDRYVSQ